MRVTYRTTDVKQYWINRWANVPVDNLMANELAYPLKDALRAVTSSSGRILEAGCGAGRILRYFHKSGHDIVGIDFVEGAISKLHEIDPTLKVEVGDITRLRFGDGTFRYVLAFGLYHNLEEGLNQAIDETWRVLEHGGTVCASFRADNLQNKVTDWLANRQARRQETLSGWEKQLTFHKLNLTRDEFIDLFERAGFACESVVPVENMPFLYKFELFRSPAH